MSFTRKQCAVFRLILTIASAFLYTTTFSQEFTETKMLLDYIQRDTGENPEYTIIWLHGLGADGHDFEPIVPELNLPTETPIRFIFPHAPKLAVTINGGMVMPAWYDIVSVDIAQRADLEGINRSSDSIVRLITAQNDAGIPSNRIILAGFSQGGAVALHTGLLHTQPLFGIIALSTYVPSPDAVSEHGHNTNKSTPIFMAHGTHDPVIPVQLGQQSYEFLQKQGYTVAWQTYPMEHSVNIDEIRDIGVWITERLADKPLP